MTEPDIDFAALGSGTYAIPRVGTVLNGDLLDGDDPVQVEAFHRRDAEAREQSDKAMRERDAILVEAVQAPTDDTPVTADPPVSDAAPAKPAAVDAPATADARPVDLSRNAAKG